MNTISATCVFWDLESTNEFSNSSSLPSLTSSVALLSTFLRRNPAFFQSRSINTFVQHSTVAFKAYGNMKNIEEKLRLDLFQNGIELCDVPGSSAHKQAAPEDKISSTSLSSKPNESLYASSYAMTMDVCLTAWEKDKRGSLGKTLFLLISADPLIVNLVNKLSDQKDMLLAVVAPEAVIKQSEALQSCRAAKLMSAEDLVKKIHEKSYHSKQPQVIENEQALPASENSKRSPVEQSISSEQDRKLDEEFISLSSMKYKSSGFLSALENYDPNNEDLQSDDSSLSSFGSSWGGGSRKNSLTADLQQSLDSYTMGSSSLFSPANSQGSNNNYFAPSMERRESLYSLFPSYGNGAQPQSQSQASIVPGVQSPFERASPQQRYGFPSTSPPQNAFMSQNNGYSNGNNFNNYNQNGFQQQSHGYSNNGSYSIGQVQSYHHHGNNNKISSWGIEDILNIVTVLDQMPTKQLEIGGLSDELLRRHMRHHTSGLKAFLTKNPSIFVFVHDSNRNNHFVRLAADKNTIRAQLAALSSAEGGMVPKPQSAYVEERSEYSGRNIAPKDFSQVLSAAKALNSKFISVNSLGEKLNNLGYNTRNLRKYLERYSDHFKFKNADTVVLV